jgi:hypothetical protein
MKAVERGRVEDLVNKTSADKNEQMNLPPVKIVGVLKKFLCIA